MKNGIIILIFLALLSCKSTNSIEFSQQDIWKLGWRMIENSMNENYQLSNLQFDSLLSISEQIEYKFLITGLEVKSQIGMDSEIETILNSQSKETLIELCKREFLREYNSCVGVPAETVDNPILQSEIIKMYVNDQAVRGNLMNDIITKYNIDTTSISMQSMTDVDASNRFRLKKIFSQYGFPTKKLVGKDAMHGIFLIIQHSDRDKAWQKSQLINIELSVENGDMDGQSYAYLYDRIKINNGEKQRYGTQFSNVDPINNKVELAPTENINDLDKRRRQIGLMPIEMYEKFMLKTLK